jgi:hypothetical protein
MLTPQTTDVLDLASDGGPPGVSQELRAPTAVKGKAKGWLWFVLLSGIVGVAGYAVWRTSRPATPERAQSGGTRQGGGRGGGGRGGALGLTPVVVANASRSIIPVYLNGLGNVSAFYTVTVKSRSTAS